MQYYGVSMPGHVFAQDEVPPGFEFEETLLNNEESDAPANSLAGPELLVAAPGLLIAVVAVGIGLAVLLVALRFLLKSHAAKPCSDDCEPEGSICGDCEVTHIEIVPYGDPSSADTPDIDDVTRGAKLVLQIPRRLLRGPIKPIMRPFWQAVDEVLRAATERAWQLRRHQMRHGVDVWVHYQKPICQRRGDCLKCEPVAEKRKVPALPSYKFLGVTDAWDFNKLAANREGFEQALERYLQTLCAEGGDGDVVAPSREGGEDDTLPCVSPWRKIDTVRVGCRGTVPSTSDEEKDVVDANAKALENGEERFIGEVSRLVGNASDCPPPCEKIWEVRNAEYAQAQGIGPMQAGQITAVGVISADVYIRCARGN